jgi:hypothetical protein
MVHLQSKWVSVQENRFSSSENVQIREIPELPVSTKISVIFFGIYRSANPDVEPLSESRRCHSLIVT